jgi:hypothetical protein
MATNIDKLNGLKTRLLKVQQDAASARARVEQAKANADKAAEELRGLGFDTDSPIEPQLEQVYDQTVLLLEEVEKSLNDAKSILTPTAG